MRIMHTADWHIGKKLAGFDLQADQAAVFAQLLATAEAQHVDAVIIAGDLYDRSLPGEDAVTMVNQQLFSLNRTAGLPLLVVSGNHDSAVRLSTGRDWYHQTGLYLNTKLAEAFTPVVIGDTQFFLLPYFEPVAARQYFGDASLTSIAKAMVPVVAAMQTQFAPGMKHVLVGHFFAAGSAHSDSETQIQVGGLDAVPVATLAAFDYVALGHLHNRHALKSAKIQYSGALLQYAVSEVNQAKGVYILDTETMTREFVALPPRRRVQHLTDSYARLSDPAVYRELDRDAYTAITLTDTQVIPNVMTTLRGIFPQIISLDRAHGVTVAQTAAKQLTTMAPEALLAQFYREVTGEHLPAPAKKWADKALGLAKGDD